MIRLIQKPDYLYNQIFNFMIIKTHALHFHPRRGLINFIQEHLEKLETFYHHFKKGEVFLRVNNEGKENKTVEIRLDIPGAQLFAVNKGKSFEEATIKATKSLKTQVIKFKEKIVKKHHRG